MVGLSSPFGGVARTRVLMALVLLQESYQRELARILELPLSGVQQALRTLERDGLVLVDERPDGVLIRPAVALPVGVYSPERKAEFLLNNAVGAKDYARVRAVVKKELGLDPDSIPHVRPRA